MITFDSDTLSVQEDTPIVLRATNSGGQVDSGFSFDILLVNNIVVDSFTVTFDGGADEYTLAIVSPLAEAGDTVSIVVQDDGDTDPTAPQVVAGQAGTGGTLHQAISFAWPSSTAIEVTANITAPTAQAFVVIERSGSLTSNVEPSNVFAVNTVAAPTGPVELFAGTVSQASGLMTVAVPFTTVAEGDVLIIQGAAQASGAFTTVEVGGLGAVNLVASEHTSGFGGGTQACHTRFVCPASLAGEATVNVTLTAAGASTGIGAISVVKLPSAAVLTDNSFDQLGTALDMSVATAVDDFVFACLSVEFDTNNSGLFTGGITERQVLATGNARFAFGWDVATVAETRAISAVVGDASSASHAAVYS